MPKVKEKKRVTYNPAAVDKYKKKAYDRLEISVRKGRKAKIKAIAEYQGESLNGFVVAAIDERVARLDSQNISDKKSKSENNKEHARAWREFFEEISNIDDEPLPEKFERVKLREVEV